MRVDLAKYYSLFEGMHFLTNDPLKLNNAVKACLMNLKNILYYVFSLITCEYPQSD